MPELPEVETVKNGLQSLVVPPVTVQKIRLYRDDLRFPIPKSIVRKVKGQTLHQFRRRAKYLIWELDRHLFVSHLGMTGTWREADGEPLKKHDHIQVFLSNGQSLIYNDPRRFGFVELVDIAQEDSYERFSHLGPEPLSRKFSAKSLAAFCAGRKGPIKNLIMNQQVVVGVGNIYASEALFKAKVHPKRPAGDLTAEEYRTLVKCIKAVLKRAIEAGGSTISDFRQAGGSEGYFQHNFRVYGRDGELCRTCAYPIEQVPLSGRSTFFCPECQT